ncbi:hypothetical protein COX58_00080 [archaeon CG_4_10_14_0_2_um_filter_Archaea_38_6]|nr:MAG: hypothetical protein COS83_02450 [archaeon CG07_land_8_20_14_0_80_38_8]PIU88456.1 MAG: hypothetical protein COS64_03835 [archaeon CG06_land_8_20_14_3_00_37_11]PJA23183.1 MAG: hypothetical protein COX58_00080 [archaeon CG_4_10_14_0_2_um_filter_Archaea_38_6]
MSLVGTIKLEKKENLVIKGIAEIFSNGKYFFSSNKVCMKNVEIRIKELNNYLVPVLDGKVLIPLHYKNSIYSMEKLCKGNKSPVGSDELMSMIESGEENQLLTFDGLGFGLNVASDLNRLSKSLIKYSIIKNSKEDGLSDEKIKSLLANNGFKAEDLKSYERLEKDWKLLTYKWYRLGLLKI